MPKALINNFASSILFPIGVNGVSNCNLLDAESTSISISEPSTIGATYPGSSTSNPLGGNSKPVGSSNFTTSPFLFVKVSVIGLKSSLPEIAIAVTISGEATKA